MDARLKEEITFDTRWLEGWPHNCRGKACDGSQRRHQAADY